MEMCGERVNYRNSILCRRMRSYNCEMHFIFFDDKWHKTKITYLQNTAVKDNQHALFKLKHCKTFVWMWLSIFPRC